MKEKLIQEFKLFEAALNGQSKSEIHQVRREAIQQFEKSGFPTVKNEDWKYSNVKPILKDEYKQIIINEDKIDDEVYKSFEIPFEKHNRLVFVNGRFIEKLSNIIDETDGLVIGSFAKANTFSPQLIKNHFAKYANVENEAFVALNTAFAQDGLFVHVPDRVVVEHPIYVIHISDNSLGPVLCQPRNLIIGGENCEVNIVQHFIHKNDKAPVLNNTVTEITAAKHARINHFIIQDENGSARNITETQVHQEKESRVDCHNYSLESGFIRNKTNMVLNDEHIEGHLYGVYLLNEGQHADNRSLIDHAKPNCYSNELYKGILGGKAKGVFNGRIMVRQDAQKTNAYQTNRNILVSDNAQVFTKPQLEIFADDVRCSHGCTTGQLDEDSIFYLRSRGLTLKQAQTYLLKAFAGEVIENVTIDVVKEWLDKRITDKILKMMAE